MKPTIFMCLDCGKQINLTQALAHKKRNHTVLQEKEEPRKVPVYKAGKIVKYITL